MKHPRPSPYSTPGVVQGHRKKTTELCDFFFAFYCLNPTQHKSELISSAGKRESWRNATQSGEQVSRLKSQTGVETRSQLIARSMEPNRWWCARTSWRTRRGSSLDRCWRRRTRVVHFAAKSAVVCIDLYHGGYFFHFHRRFNFHSLRKAAGTCAMPYGIPGNGIHF